MANINTETIPLNYDYQIRQLALNLTLQTPKDDRLRIIGKIMELSQLELVI